MIERAMTKDTFWNDGTSPQRRHEGVSAAMNAAAQRENNARAEAAEQKRLLEEAAKEPQKALCKRCGEMSFNPCKP